MKNDHSKLKKLHPKAKVGNIKRLIKAIRESEHMHAAEAKHLPFNECPKINGREMTVSMTTVESAKKLSSNMNSNVPLVFNMCMWLEPAFIYLRKCKRRKTGHRSQYQSCGTAACIAGFAGALMAKGNPGRNHCKIIDDAIGDKNYMSWSIVLAEFMGIEASIAEKMTSVQDYVPCDMNHIVRPRHAVKLLEKFLDTGKVDWMHAMGRRRNSRGILTKAEMAMRIREAGRYGE